ncbi:hypothetical protein [Aliarcobacter skirrowii]|uniref:Uncharacterized protein n=1 Tax=Aliarcobacter skirrowii TaxID=28200 RepID=A0AAW9DA54_9BACT|nr:hypothetical protein [Aliarcobacter skirrowii]MDX4069036.1 hypothetical protein [Aliarcobacter skirrowii]
MIEKIIFMSFGSITTNLYESLCIDIFKKQGLEVDIIDLNNLFFNYDAPIIKEYNIIVINSYKELEDYFIENIKKSTIYNIQFNYETRFYKFFRLVTRYKCKVSKFEIGYHPTIEFNNNLRIIFKNPFKLIKRISEKIFDKIVFKTNIIKINYTLRFVAGKKAYDIAKQSVTSNIIIINYIDYERYLELSSHNVSCIVEYKKYFVFLDSYLHMHEDNKFQSRSKDFNGEIYLKTLNKLFDYLETTYKVDIIIAAHPKSNYTNNEFKHRKIIKNNTANLVKNADLVISDCSTSISYCTLFYKPIMFCYTDDIIKYFNREYLYIKIFAKELNNKAINLDQDYSDFKLEEVNQEVYNKYKYNYLTSKESENYRNEEIVIKWLKNLISF